MKRTNQTASRVMKLAHQIKSQFTTFSAALKAAWAKFKKPAKSIIERLIEMGGKRWTKSETLDRVYFDFDVLMSILGYSTSGSRETAKKQGKKFFIYSLKSFKGAKLYFDLVSNQPVFGSSILEREFLELI